LSAGDSPICIVKEFLMSPVSFDRAQSAPLLLAQVVRESAKDGEMIDQILHGTQHFDSWIIANRILPLLPETKTIGFSLALSDAQQVEVLLAPLVDGSAFACNADGVWLALAADDAQREIGHIGERYAVGDCWQEGFQASLKLVDETRRPLAPLDLASLWEEATGIRPPGFETGVLDHIRAYGLDTFDRIFHTQSRLGL
jgi:hypothetical protein